MARPKKADARTITYKVRLNEEENRILTEPCITITKASEKARKQKAFSLKLRT